MKHTQRQTGHPRTADEEVAGEVREAELDVTERGPERGEAGDALTPNEEAQEGARAH
ncbi:hypothetical protein [Streptomyces sp. NPDC007883]|uniref:hypothetical protein n=1 Tax=Streptomyces sp. NPDC007883 TaxID=3155116 RepID=UPI0033E10408